MIIRNPLAQEVGITIEGDFAAIAVDTGVLAALVTTHRGGDAGDGHRGRVVQPDFVLIIRNLLAQKVGITLKGDFAAIAVDTGLLAVPVTTPRGGGDAGDGQRGRVVQLDFSLRSDNPLAQKVGITLKGDFAAIAADTGVLAVPVTTPRSGGDAGE